MAFQDAPESRPFTPSWRTIIGVFQEEASRSMTEIRAAIDRGEASKMIRTAHSLRGAVGVFDVAAAFEAAQTLESMGREGGLTDVEDAYKALEIQINRLTLALAEIVS
jgi:two-component system, sensor histidine kinase and response regulator